MARRDGKLRAYLEAMQRGDAGTVEDPFAGIPPQLAETHLYGVTGGAWWNGWDGAHAGRIKVHRDGHHTSHTGACAIEPVEDPIARIVRQASLDRYEAELVRDMAQHVGREQTDRVRAHRLGWAERTTRRRRHAIEQKLRALGYSERHLQGDA